MKDDKEAITAKLRPYLTDKELAEFWENREHPENEWIKHGVEMRDAASILSRAFCWEASAQDDVYWYEIYRRIHNAIEEENKEMPELQQIAAHLRQQIKESMTLEQIIEEYKQADYSAEMLLQHLFLWVANNQPNNQPMNTQELIEAVRQWGIDKGITGPSGKGTLLGQLSKTQEELIETRDAAVILAAIRAQYAFDIDHGLTLAQVMDGIGDCAVTLILAAEMAGLNFEDCLAAAYEVISKRTGRMENGQFVKDA